MSTEQALTPSSYIGHHLSFNVKHVAEGGFWSVNADSISVSVFLGLMILAFFWWVARGATAGVPGKRQAFIELLFEFIDDQAKGNFHGDRHEFVAPAALTVFVWVFAMNSMDFLPIDIMAWIFHHVFGQEHFRAVPTSDINIAFALALSVLLLTIFFSIKVKGLGGWMHELFCAPFGSHPLAWPCNFLLNLVEYISKSLSHAMRLFGNMYAGEIIFLLIGMWAATGLSGTIFGALLGTGWAIFDILIVAVQAYIFTILTVVYIAMAHESH
jgi:F-type H+-transporting ATPase subunit a